MSDIPNTRTCGEAIVALLEKYDVEIVFGIPGVHTLELYRGLVGSKIRHILPRHEQGAGFMADGYARASGKPGVCFLITGPGVTNAATPIAQAYSDSVPMLVISSVNETSKLGKGLGELHEMPDQLKMTSAFTAFSARANSPEEIPGLLARAFDVFNSARPRPVHIEVPIDIFDNPVAEEWQATPVAVRPQVCGDLINDAALMLERAESPLILAGGGAIGCESELLTLAERLSAPVVTSVAGSGVFPSSHSLSLGSTLVGKATHQMITKADVVLVIGSELASTETWSEQYRFGGKLIRIDIDPKQFENSFVADLALIGDAKPALAEISEKLKSLPDAKKTEAKALEVAAALEDFDNSLDEAEQMRATVFRTVVDALPEQMLVVADMTQIGYTGHSVFRPETFARFFHPTGYGTLGYALPAGIGAKLGAPQKPVVVFVGDGGLLYTLQEMATAREEGLPVLVILWNNQLLQQIHEGFVDHGIEPIAVFPQNPDFQMLARAFGWETHQIADIDGLADLVKQAEKSAETNKRPVMIEVLANEL